MSKRSPKSPWQELKSLPPPMSKKVKRLDVENSHSNMAISETLEDMQEAARNSDVVFLISPDRAQDRKDAYTAWVKSPQARSAYTFERFWQLFCEEKQELVIKDMLDGLNGAKIPVIYSLDHLDRVVKLTVRAST